MPTALLLLTTIALAAALAAEAGEPRRTLLLPQRGADPGRRRSLYLALRITAAGPCPGAHQPPRRNQRPPRHHPAEYESYCYWHLPGADADLWYFAHVDADRAAACSIPASAARPCSSHAQAAQRATRSAEEPSPLVQSIAQIASQREDYATTGFQPAQSHRCPSQLVKPHLDAARNCP